MGVSLQKTDEGDKGTVFGLAPWPGHGGPVQKTSTSRRPNGLGCARGREPVEAPALDVLKCPNCQGRMTLLAVIKQPANTARHLAAAGETTEVKHRSPGRGPPYWKTQVLRRQVLGDEEDSRESHGHGGDEAACWR